ncbi:MAG: sel1 repeat family protein [Candidatus Magasanikbacteria bacterium]|jgi:uncharacterized protein|nr:sel1 repeat family protein [Candidatus Magasanikbacteria bacterium]
MNLKLTFLLALTFLFLFSGSSVVFADDYQDGVDAFKRKDYETANKLLLPLAKQQEGFDAYNKGDYKKAYEVWLPLAMIGDASAQYNLGVLHAEGKGVPKDEKESLKWWKLSAEQGISGAQFNIGQIYSKGILVLKDYEEAVKWYRLAAEQGFALAQYNLGGMYFDGRGVQQDYKKSIRWYRLAAEQGIPAAQSHLGVSYQHGTGVPQDYKEAIKWYRLAVEKEFANAQYNLGGMYHYGLGVKQDYKEAIKWYQLAAQQGYSEGQNNLGGMFEYGLGVKQDYKEAIKWYQLAANQGHEKAKINLKKISSLRSNGEFMDGIINWIFFESIFGVFIITGIFFGITSILKKLIPNLPDFTTFGGILFLVLLCTMQTYPRYKFHKKALETIENLPPYAHIIDKKYIGDILEPLTWFKSFIGDLYIVAPSFDSGFSGEFKSMRVRYDDYETIQQVSLHEIDCKTKETSISQADKKGAFRYTLWNEKMTEYEIELFCKKDWSEEREIMRTEIMNSAAKQKKQNTIENKKGKD